jgi:hypothetical protein
VPATSKKQERFMQAVANNPKFAKKAGVPQSVGREFTKDTTMKCGTKGKMAKGGGVEAKGKTKGKMVKMAMGGAVGNASKRADGIVTKGKTKCKVM